MTPRTIAEKILSRTSGRPARAGDFVVCSPDLAMGTDGSVPMALDGLAAMQREPAGLSPASRFLFALVGGVSEARHSGDVTRFGPTRHE